MPAARLLSALVPLAAAAAMWWPLTRNYFFADDFLHLFDLRTLPLPRFLTQIWGGHLYLVRNAVFAGMFQLFGPNPRPWFWTVLCTHLISVLLLHRLVLRSTGDRALACFGATLWGTCPVLEGALGWYAVYGQVLLTALLLVVLVELSKLAASGRRLSGRRALGWGAILAAGAACFGTGLAVAAVFPLVVAVDLPRRRWSVAAVGALALTAAAVLAVYVGLRRWTADPNAQANDVLSLRTTLAHVPEALLFTAHLLGFGTSTLVLGYCGLDAHYPSAATTAADVGVLAVALGGWAAASATGRRRLTALALLLAASYAAVSAGRAGFFGVFHYPIARAATSPRYHYLPLALVTVLFCLALAPLRDWSSATRRGLHAAAAALVVMRLVLLGIHPLAIDHHDTQRKAVEAVLQSVRAAAAAAPPGAAVRVENQPFPPAVIPWLFPGSAGVFLIFEPHDTIDGHLIRFVAPDRDWRLAQDRGGRIATLVERRAAAGSGA